MIPIDREPKPEILAEKQAEWLAAFIAKRNADPKARPDSSKYAHKSVKDALRRMSHGKCFYCEAKPEGGAEVDHHVEVADDLARVFTWENLYLSCRRCNQAKRLKHVQLDECVDPCAPDSDPAAHLTFDDEQILPRSGSARGRATIRKYHLDDPLLDLQRSRALRELETARRVIQDRRLAQGGRSWRVVARARRTARSTMRPTAWPDPGQTLDHLPIIDSPSSRDRSTRSPEWDSQARRRSRWPTTRTRTGAPRRTTAWPGASSASPRPRGWSCDTCCPR